MKSSAKPSEVILDPSAIRVVNGFDDNDKKMATLVDDVSMNPKEAKKKASIFGAWDFDENEDENKTRLVYDV